MCSDSVGFLLKPRDHDIYHFVNFCISNFTVFVISESKLFLVLLQKVLFSVLLWAQKFTKWYI